MTCSRSHSRARNHTEHSSAQSLTSEPLSSMRYVRAGGRHPHWQGTRKARRGRWQRVFGSRPAWGEGLAEAADLSAHGDPEDLWVDWCLYRPRSLVRFTERVSDTEALEIEFTALCGFNRDRYTQEMEVMDTNMYLDCSGTINIKTQQSFPHLSVR